MSSHQVIARKWRPQKFGDVVGQTHVIRTLRNAIAGNRVGHAYLLVGPRGIGKTTIARIFAKAINCENPHDGEPCCECSSCKALAAESSLDVIEIDAASRNSVEHMRALSEEAYHMPVASKFKIYIIDEVHMLSKAAWNALLKTVEEPPAHVKFIFATTEAHLVLPTIVSRCQRFDLRPIAGNLILNRLKLIAESENVKIAPEALSAIARAAEGGMRDAQSSLEQMLAFFGGKDQEIAAEQVLELFGLTNAVELDTLVGAMLQNQPGPVVTIVNELASRGRNLETLFDDVLEMLRGAELMHILNNPGAVLDFDDEKLERCRKLAGLSTPEALRCFMENLSPVGRILHEALNKTIYLESILLKAMHEAHAPTVGDVLARLNQLRGAGELQFVEQVPTFTQLPKTPVMPVTLPELPKEEVQNKKTETIPPANPEPQIEAAIEPLGEIVSEVDEPVAEEAVQVENQPENFVQTAPAVNSNASDSYESLWQGVTALVEGALADTLKQCSAVKMENSVLSIAVPSDLMPVIHENRLIIMQLLQKVSGNWAILPDFQSVKSEAAPEKPVADAAEITQTEDEELPPEEYIEETFAKNPSVQPVVGVEEVAETHDNSHSDGDSYLMEFIDLNAEDGELPPDMEELSRQELGYSQRSVIHDPEEVAATAKLPPVQKVLDLFGGEIVDIHA